MHAADPQAALQEPDIDHVVDDLESDAHLQDKARAGAQARLGHHAQGDGDGNRDHIEIDDPEDSHLAWGKAID